MNFRISGYAVLVVLLISFASCHYSNQYHLVDTNNKFTIEVPEWMKRDADLKPGADFQYANRFRNFYAIGETQGNAGNDLDSLMKFNLNVLRKSLVKPIVSDSTSDTINGLIGVRVEIFGKMSNENIYFSEVLLAGKKHVYHLSVWTRGEDRKLKYKTDIDKILSSFKEKD
jgi:hypothetical protein